MSTKPEPDGRVTVSMLTYNRCFETLESLERILALPERPAVILVDNGSTDGTTQEVARHFPQVDVVRLPENRGSAARNIGAARAWTEYVAFSDDDTWWEAGALSHAADLLDRHPSLALVTGRVLVGDEDREDPVCLEMAQSPLPREPELPGTPVLGFMAGASIVRRSAFLSVGGFERRLFLGGEERLLAVDLVAAGWALAYVPEVQTHHHPSPHREVAQRQALLLRNALWFAWLRRPTAVALAATWELAQAARQGGPARRAVAEALRGLPWALSRRRVVPRHVEDNLRRLAAAYH